MLLSLTTYAQPSTVLTIADGSSTPPYALAAGQVDWGNALHDHTFSGPRGTQGARPSAGIVQNRIVNLPLRVYGTDKNNLASSLRDLSNTIDELRRFGGRISWTSNGQSYRQHLEVLTTDGAHLGNWNNRAENRSIANVDLALVCQPYALGDTLDVDDRSFSTTLTTDYTLDNGTIGNLSATSDQIKATASTSTEYRMVQTQRGYTLTDAEITTKLLYNQANGFKAGVIFWRSSATSYWLAYVDDTGSATRLRIDQVSSGTATNRATSTLGARLSGGQWVRVRTQGTAITAEQWASTPTPMSAPTNTVTYTASAQGSGLAGMTLTPQSTTNYLASLQIRPFTYYNQALPLKVSVGTVPGDSPALANFELTTKQALAWTMIGWQQTAGTSSLSGSPTPTAAFQVFNGNGDVTANRQGWTTADTTNNLINTTSMTTSTPCTAHYALDPSLLPADAYANGDRAIEVWALIRTDSSAKLVAPTMIASLQTADGGGQVRYTDEWGSVGRVVPTLASSASTYGLRWTRLGTLHLPQAGAREMRLVINATVSTSSSGGRLGLARVLLVAQRQRVALPTGKSADSSYPKWTSVATETTKTVDSDLSTSVCQPGSTTITTSDRSIGGSLPEILPGATDLIIAAGRIVPDDPSAITSTEYLGQTTPPTTTSQPAASVHLSITPRYAQLRS